MRKLMKVADFFTIGNIIFGVLSIFYAISSQFKEAVIFMLIAVLFDFLDGKVARLMNEGATEFGKELDSLCDLVSFGVAPAVFAYCLGLNDPISIIILVFFVVCGMLRLARFNVTKVKHFEGVPITTNGYLVPAIYIISLFFSFNLYYYLIYFFVMGGLMISKFRIKKV